MSNDTPAQTEATSETVEFEHFGLNWSVPTRKHHRHIREAKQIMRAEGGLDADDIAAIYLSPDEYNALCDLDVSAEDLTEFAGAIASALGLGGLGNSEPSSTPS